MASKDYDLIHPRLAQGSAPRDSLASFEEFDSIVLCAAEYQPEVEFPDNDKSKRIIRCPFNDTEDVIDMKTSKMLRRTARKVVSDYREGQRILITCFAGLNRSGLIMGLVLKEILDLSGHEAISLIRSRRYGALRNPTFCKYLIYSPSLN